jgi:Fanconi anemia group M protein
MCNELRVTKQQMLDFIQGKPSSSSNVNDSSSGENVFPSIIIHNPYKKRPQTASQAPSNQSNSREDVSMALDNISNEAVASLVPKQAPSKEPWIGCSERNDNSNKQLFERGKPEQNEPNKKQLHLKPTGTSNARQTMKNPFTASSKSPSVYEPGQIPLCAETADEWIYPVLRDFPMREYQRQISETAIFANTLVSLPTGLGKTLIAAVVLYNYYRWFPTGKIVFMAPTLPLVNQQVQACYDIMGIPAEDTAILTGKVKADDRTKFWMGRRVFFCTPQTVQKDLESKRCLAEQVVCLVLDEAHKASGDYAYTQVVQLLRNGGAKFRLVGLSATPGTNIKAIQRVVDMLQINRIEARFENDIDVKKYMHERHSEIIVVKNSTVASSVERKLNNLIGPLLDTLRQGGALTRFSGNATIVPYNIIQAREAYKTNVAMDPRLLAYFAAAQKFVQCRADLRTHGIGVVRNRLLRLKNEPNRGVLATIVKSDEFQTLWEEMATGSFDPDSSQAASLDRKMNNPKLSKLDEILTEHFERSRACGESSRAIVFSQWRESVSEIVEVLSISKPLLRPRHFVGQGKAVRTAKGKQSDAQPESVAHIGMKQNEQQQVIREFREGIHNVLVCTCIGEEGLDIGEVDLIINYDTLRSPIRMIQRTGRTGRKRNGRVVCLVSEGQEQRTFHQSKDAEVTLGRALKNASAFKLHPNRSMFPQKPRCTEKDMSIKPGFHLSQVGGHIRSARQGRDLSDAAGEMAASWSWQLTDEQERIRSEHFGPIGQLPSVSTLSALPRSALRSFLIRRLYSLSKDKSSLGGTKGVTQLILHEFETKSYHEEYKMLPSANHHVHASNSVSKDSFPLLYVAGDGAEALFLPSADERICKKQGFQSTSVACLVADQAADRRAIVESVGMFHDGAVESSPPRVSASTSEFKLRTPSDSSSCNDVDSDNDTELVPNEMNENDCFLSNNTPRNPTFLYSTDSKEAAPQQFPHISFPDGQADGKDSYHRRAIPESPIVQLPSQEESSDDECIDQNSLLDRSKETRRETPFRFEEIIEKENVPFASNCEKIVQKSALPEIVNRNQATKKRVTAILSQDQSDWSGSNATTRFSGRGDSFSNELFDTPESHPRQKKDGSLFVCQEDNFVCAVCFLSDFEEDDPIVFCDGSPDDSTCTLAAHLSCYSIPLDSINVTSWHCDLCKWKIEARNSKSTDPQPKCCHCLKGDGPLRLLSEGTWHHPYCSDWLKNGLQGKCALCAVGRGVKCSVSGCNSSAHPHCAVLSRRSTWSLVRACADSSTGSSNQERKRTFSLFCPLHEAKGFEISGKQLVIKQGRGVLLIEPPIRDEVKSKSSCDEMRSMKPNVFDPVRSRRRKSLLDSFGRKLEKRRQKLRKVTARRAGDCYIDNEALIDTDDDIDGDEDESELARLDQEEAIFAQGFINDSSQLGYTQDELDLLDPDSKISNHRELDSARERANIFATPLLNRRMMKSSDTSGRRSSQSEQGLGKMHFIRSVLEHLRQGGDANDIEDFYQQVGEDVEQEETEGNASGAQEIKPAVLKYIASDSEDE